MSELPAYSLAVSVSTTRSSPRSLLFPICYFWHKFLKRILCTSWQKLNAHLIQKLTKSKLIFFSIAWFFNSFSHLSMLSNDLRSQMSKIRNAPNAFLKYLDYFVKILHKSSTISARKYLFFQSLYNVLYKVSRNTWGIA